MRIKRIDLCGFKSFSDKTALDLRQSITCVVGPNGCGKSNIVDALRWAMGEQSARHLRGKAMSDVIFNGSESRGPSGTAEISITFENDGRVPPEYTGYAEITVSRVLHRDGTSEYMINRLPVRLLDITNLFLGTGVGTKAYSIIEQGRVGLIVSAKPEDRRHYIEEAAGITKYRRRRLAAERKMEATRQNLLRVSDVIEEIGKRLGSLRRQARKAERYKQYKSEMRDIELWSASHKFLGLIAERKVLDAANAATLATREKAQADLDLAETRIEAARLETADQERQLNALQEELYQVDNRIKLAESAIEFHAKEADDLEQRAAQAAVEIEQLTQQRGEAQAELDEVALRLEETAERRLGIEAELAGREALLAALRRELGEVEQAAEAEREQVAAAERGSAEAEANLRALRQRREDLHERQTRRRDEGRRLIDRLAELRASASDIDGQLGQLRLGLEELKQHRQEVIARVDTLREAADRGEAELEVLRTELHRRRSRLASLQEIQERYEGFERGTRAIMQRVNGDARARGILGLVADIVNAPASYETALEAVLGQRIGTVIVEDPEIGVDAIQYLKQNAEGRSSFIAPRAPSLLDSAPIGLVWDAERSALAADGLQTDAPAARPVPIYSHDGVHGPILDLIDCKAEFQPVAQALLEDVVVVESLERAVHIWDNLGEKTLVTLEGDILHPDGTVTGGSLDAEAGGVLRQKREIKELTEIIADLQARYDEALDRQVTTKSEIAALQHRLEEATRDGHQSDKDILTREKDLGRIDSEVQALEHRRREIDEEMQHLHDTSAQLDAQELELRGAIEQAAAVQHLGRDIIGLLGGERARLAALVDGAASSVTDGKVALAQAVASCQAIEEKLQQLDRVAAERNQRIERLTADAADGRSRAVELREKVARLQHEVKELVTQRAECQDTLSAGRQRYDEHVARLGELEASLKELRRQVGELAEQLSQHSLRASELQMRREHLEEQVWERYREQLRCAAGDFHLRPPVSEDQLGRLDKLRQLIDRMGEINLTAIEEYEELNERFQFLSTHKQDLEGALSQLQRAIQKINRTCRKRFKETFEAVDAKFQEVFPRLFAGGKARLLLVDAEQDVLQGGVDIVAQPPGKKLQSIEMMSGGEKALTAVSLIFAMFLVKPTPFCLLDEVDAPLDEANVIRFRELIDEMSAHSQFIVITHNRRTMEIGERLFGVTMEEPGISKIVSVNLSDAEQGGMVN